MLSPDFSSPVVAWPAEVVVVVVLVVVLVVECCRLVLLNDMVHKAEPVPPPRMSLASHRPIVLVYLGGPCQCIN